MEDSCTKVSNLCCREGDHGGWLTNKALALALYDIVDGLCGVILVRFDEGLLYC